MSFILVVMCFSGCAGTPDAPQDEKNGLSVVTTVFPLYDWVVNVLGTEAENTDIAMLLDSGVDLHSFQPSADDIVKISKCDVFVYVGGESDKWVEDALKEASNADMTVIDLMQVLGSAVKTEETVEGMQGEAESGEEETEYDEHIWLSLKNAVTAVGAISEALSQKEPEKADIYSANAAAFTEKLTSLDKEYETFIGGCKNKTLLFADRFPFRYLTDDYSLEYFAAFSGCSAESEADFETVRFLAAKVDELSLSCVLTLEGSDTGIAQTVIGAAKSADVKILSIDSMQSKTAADIENGTTYLSVMTDNLEVLKQALV